MIGLRRHDVGVPVAQAEQRNECKTHCAIVAEANAFMLCYQKYRATTFGELGAPAITLTFSTSCRFFPCHPAGAFWNSSFIRSAFVTRSLAASVPYCVIPAISTSIACVSG